jgi:hypothetical protein
VGTLGKSITRTSQIIGSPGISSVVDTNQALCAVTGLTAIAKTTMEADVARLPKAPADLWEQLDAIRGSSHMTVVDDEDLFTTRQYAERYGLPTRTAYEQIQKLLQSKLVEVAFVKGRTFFYRPLSK